MTDRKAKLERVIYICRQSSGQYAGPAPSHGQLEPGPAQPNGKFDETTLAGRAQTLVDWMWEGPEGNYRDQCVAVARKLEQYEAAARAEAPPHEMTSAPSDEPRKLPTIAELDAILTGARTCVCGHPLSRHEPMGNVLGCLEMGCACAPGCIHEGWVDASGKEDAAALYNAGRQSRDDEGKAMLRSIAAGRQLLDELLRRGVSGSDFVSNALSVLDGIAEKASALRPGGGR